LSLNTKNGFPIFATVVEETTWQKSKISSLHTN
jgi:hypothetical protein